LPKTIGADLGTSGWPREDRLAAVTAAAYSVAINPERRAARTRSTRRIAVRVAARIRNTGDDHRVDVMTSGTTQNVSIAAKASGFGSAVNGGEFLMLALATCYCNDIYREAARLNIAVDSVEVEAQADFDGVGLAATNITYRARVASSASEAEIDALLCQTDAVAEVQNTIRAGASVSRKRWDRE
jgi:organic hydroperoxide reductase OsmC/OhrA